MPFGIAVLLGLGVMCVARCLDPLLRLLGAPVSQVLHPLAACMVPSAEAHDVLGGHLACLRSFGAVPRLGVYDQEGCIGEATAQELA